MPHYETLCVLHPELPETRLKEMAVWMQKIIESANGAEIRVEEWGMRDLGYLIKKQRRGYYVRLEYDAPATTVKELGRNLRINEDVLRFLSVVRQKPTAAQTSPPPAAAAPAASPETDATQQ